MNFLEYVTNKDANFVLKAWMRPDARKTVLGALQRFNLNFNAADDSDPHYLEAIYELKDILPELLKVPEFRKAAEELQMLIAGVET